MDHLELSPGPSPWAWSLGTWRGQSFHPYPYPRQFENLFKNLGGVNDGFPQEIDLADLSSRKEFNRDELVNNLMFGTPDQVISKLKQYQDIGVDQFTYCASFGLGQAAQKRSLELFINEVMPAFDQSASATAERQTAS